MAQELETPSANPEKARECFRKAQGLVAVKNYDYAIELYISGLEHWPDAVEEGHKPCRAAALFRGGSKISLGDKMKYGTGGKDAKKAMLNAEMLLSKDPHNIAYMEAMFKNAEKAGCFETAMWIGEIYADAAVREAKPNIARFQLLRDTYERLADRVKDQNMPMAITAMERVVDALTKMRNLKPTDGVISNDLRDMAGKLTILKGNYSQAESFVDSIRDADQQKEIYDKDRLITDAERFEELVATVQARYDANPRDQRVLNELVELLCRRENEAEEKRAIAVLLKAFKETEDYRFKSRACDILMKQKRRAERAARDSGDEQRYREAAKERLEFELSVYKDRMKNYPTDLRLRYEYGRRLFEKRRFDDAIPYLQEARADRKVRFNCSLTIGRCFYEKGYYAQAADTFREAIDGYEIRDDDLGKELHYWLGRTYESAGQTEDALKIYGQLIQWDYNYRKGDVRKRIDDLRGSQGK
ncbi:MAG TPA: tetratricopeptide repeat protein [Phycisphaerae bacterium]|nr:tetratricopeptide repeat protein [Phycisphaerae bacterium]HOJ73072.1 tetratricopeptide repeat protein [Phycisphaerae bacterium]HOM52688.1 tetratricopeptide repeat protein [Phycisphaerae bacterium]HON66038.1 tetratricopeptide repeat protein [Phycisphaerae bacterium]HOQ85057.1 tetratricopeptide repeat protein [Phycisphaerae bacterium]